MMQLHQKYPVLVDHNAEVIVVGPDSAKAFKKFWKVKSLPFVGLPDPKHRVLKQLGQEFKLLKLGRMPAQIVLDGEGKARYAHFSNSMSDITGVDEIESILAEMDNPE